MRKYLVKEISEEEVMTVLHSFQKGKSRSPDGFTLDLFLGFYDLLKDDILKVVRESQGSRKFLGEMNATFIALIPKK